jgi:hypothetical protein
MQRAILPTRLDAWALRLTKAFEAGPRARNAHPTALHVSPAGLTRGSIHSSQEAIAKVMDCRVKPGNDDQTQIGAGGKCSTSPPGRTIFARMLCAILPTRLDAGALRLTKAFEAGPRARNAHPTAAILARLDGGTLRRKPSSNFEQQLLQDRLFEIIEAD